MSHAVGWWVIPLGCVLEGHVREEAGEVGRGPDPKGPWVPTKKGTLF